MSLQMSQNETITFSRLFKRLDFVEIPLLQRDYAQGREHEGEIRNLFLGALHQAISRGSVTQPLDLDFVYGNFEGLEAGSFSVLDGQQRLTTLFLLHWFLALKDNQLESFRDHFVTQCGRSKFTYQTRPSTTDFFNALTNQNFILSRQPIRELIADSQWFYSSWHLDPTVKACLCMLDAIQVRFGTEPDNTYKKLMNDDQPLITFQFLNLPSFGLSDELYIKMNARGKPLTVFENFKAKLEKIIATYDDSWPEYRLPFKQGFVSGFEYFIHKIDTDWSDLFWPYRNVYTDDNTFDDEMMNFIRLILANSYLLAHPANEDDIKEKRERLFGYAGKLTPVQLSQYEDWGCFSQTLIIQLIETLDLIHNKQLQAESITPHLANSIYYEEHDFFKKVIKNDTSYPEKLRFYAFYTYLAKKGSNEDLQSWLRVIYNLTENTIINNSEEFHRSLLSIHRLSLHGASILEALKANCEVTAFQPSQIVEEKIKAHLLLKSQRWVDAVLKIETHPFFNGQVGFALNFADILEFYREHQHCDWDEAQDKQFFSNFEKYANSGSETFTCIDKSSETIDYLWERAVLSKGVYFTNASANRFNLLSTRLIKNNIERDHSWKRLLRLPLKKEDAWDRRQGYVKAVFDDSMFKYDDITSSLEKICTEALNNLAITDWQKQFIKFPSLFSECKQGFISIRDESVILLSESQRNHYHGELFTTVLSYELLKIEKQLKPFSEVSYYFVKSREDSPHVAIEDWVNKKIYSIEVYFNSGTFNIQFNGIEPSDCVELLIFSLEKHGFEFTKCEPDDTVIPNYFYQNTQRNIVDVINKIVSLCSDLRDE